MRHINLKKLILVLSIIIVLNLFFNYGIKTFYPSLEYDKFCNPEIVSRTYSSKESCESIGGMWTENYDYNKPLPPQDISQPKIMGYCNPYFNCDKNYRLARDVYDRNVFIILIVLGTIAIVAGFIVNVSDAVSLGFSFGGLISLFVGTVRYWSSMNDYLRFLILGMVLVVLTVMGLKKFKENKNEVPIER